MLPTAYVPVLYVQYYDPNAMVAARSPPPPPMGQVQPPAMAPGFPTCTGLMSLCCGSVQSHRHISTHWEPQIAAFLAWLSHNGRRDVDLGEGTAVDFIVRLTTKVNGRRTCGFLEYAGGMQPDAESGLQRFQFYRMPPKFAEEHGFTDLCAFKNYTCERHGLFIKLDVLRSVT